jgi:hypothetical protein
MHDLAIFDSNHRDERVVVGGAVGAASLSLPIRFVTLRRRSAGFGTLIPPSLVGEEYGLENNSGRDSEAHGVTDLIAAQQRSRSMVKLLGCP